MVKIKNMTENFFYSCLTIKIWYLKTEKLVHDSVLTTVYLETEDRKKNPIQKEFVTTVCLSVTNFDLNYLRTDKIVFKGHI